MVSTEKPPFSGAEFALCNRALGIMVAQIASDGVLQNHRHEFEFRLRRQSRFKTGRVKLTSQAIGLLITAWGGRDKI